MGVSSSTAAAAGGAPSFSQPLPSLGTRVVGSSDVILSILVNGEFQEVEKDRDSPMQVSISEVAGTNDYQIVFTTTKASAHITAFHARVSSDLNVEFTPTGFRFVASDGNSNYVFSVAFASKSTSEEFRRGYYQCLVRSQTRDIAPKDDSERRWLESMYERDADMEDAASLDESLPEDDRDLMHTSAAAAADFGTSDRNSLLEVAKASDRAFVVRGSRIGIFKQEGDELEYQTTISGVKDMKGATFSPGRIMLNERDTTMLMLRHGEEKSGKVYRMDLEVGKVVNEWGAQSSTVDIPVRELSHLTKLGQMSGEQTFVGLNKKKAFIVDPRLPTGDTVAENTSKINQTAYNTERGFSCVATTEDGHVVIGADDGKIRLYKNLSLKSAKTELPGLGDPILGLDVTKDGHFVLATCAKYILLINTMLPGGTRTGFTDSFPEGEKPRPIMLKLTAEDAARVGRVAFSQARFDVGSNQERVILAATGSWVVMWNFRHVAGGRGKSYKLTQYSEDVVAGDFGYNNAQAAVVTTVNDVTVTKRTI